MKRGIKEFLVTEDQSLLEEKLRELFLVKSYIDFNSFP